MELHITGFHDLNQLQGFTITAAELQRLEDNTPVVSMTVTSPFYEKPYEIKLFPTVDLHFKAAGKLIEAVPGISLRAKPVEVQSGQT